MLALLFSRTLVVSIVVLQLTARSASADINRGVVRCGLNVSCVHMKEAEAVAASSDGDIVCKGVSREGNGLGTCQFHRPSHATITCGDERSVYVRFGHKSSSYNVTGDNVKVAWASAPLNESTKSYTPGDDLRVTCGPIA